MLKVTMKKNIQKKVVASTKIIETEELILANTPLEERTPSKEIILEGEPTIPSSPDFDQPLLIKRFK